MNYFRLGDTALLLNFEQHIDAKVNRQVAHFTSYLKSKEIEGILYLIPAYCSITIGYDNRLWNFTDLCERINRYLAKEFEAAVPSPQRKLCIPVCYHETFALDLDILAEEKDMTTEEFIAVHTGTDYQVFMMGFLPGFVYLGKLDHRLVCPRKNRPRIKVPSQSVALAGAQTGIYPLDAPGGWQIIGKCPIPIFRPDFQLPFLFETGDLVSFYSISLEVFEEMEHQDVENHWQKVLVNG